MKKATMKDVAKATGVSVMTVSHALRHHPCISPATAERVRQAAKDLNYSTNPLLATLLTQVRTGRESKAPPIIGYVSSFRNREGGLNHPLQKPRFEGARARAHELGFGFELFEWAAPNMTGRRLSKIMLYRKVAGLICGPVIEPDIKLDLDWHLFPCVALGYMMPDPPIHRVTISHFHSVQICLNRLTELGYSRIGVMMNSAVNDRLDCIPLGSADAFIRKLPPRRRIPPMVVTERDNAATFKAWYDKHRPDAILGGSPLHDQWIREAGLRVPRDVAVATLAYHPGHPEMAGLDPSPYHAGAAAVDVLAQQIYTNQRGIPAHQTFTLLKGVWMDGPSAPPAAARKD